MLPIRTDTWLIQVFRDGEMASTVDAETTRSMMNNDSEKAGSMIDATLMAALLDSLKDPLLLADTDHVIRYMNKSAIEYYDEGESLIGRSVLDCHNEQSQETIVEVLTAMHIGEEERLITDNEEHRIYMRAVRDADGQLLGYYERYEPPVKQGN